MSEFREWLITSGKKIFKNPAENIGPGVSQLTTTTIKNEFDKFVKRHKMINTIDYLGMLATQQAYKEKSQRAIFLDNRTRYIPEFSTDRISVYERGNGMLKILIVGVHGTRITSLEDITQDTKLLLGRVKDTALTLNYMNDLLRIIGSAGIPRDNIYLCGHSLGAYYALMAGFLTKTNVRTYNGVNEIFAISKYPNMFNLNGKYYSLKGFNSYQKATSYRVFGDPISMINQWTLKNVIKIKVDDMSVNPITLHSLDYMIDICIPEIPLDTASLSQARRFNRLPLRNVMETEGKEFKKLEEDAKNNVFSQINDFLQK